jgi:amino acid permease
VFAVEWYGEAEFWLATGKVCLLAIVFSFTFITMVGGNPKHDPYGFRYWKDPGSFAENFTTGNLGRFEGFLGMFALSNLIIWRKHQEIDLTFSRRNVECSFYSRRT